YGRWHWGLIRAVVTLLAALTQLARSTLFPYTTLFRSIALFLIYACTFGVFDFLKLDRWMREKIGGWRGIELLTEKDYRIIERNKDPKYLAKKYRRSSLIHLTLFVIVHSIFWMYGTKDFEELIGYLKDLSWIEEGTPEESHYPNEAVYAVGMIWGIVFIVDFIWSSSYTLSPSKPKE